MFTLLVYILYMQTFTIIIFTYYLHYFDYHSLYFFLTKTIYIQAFKLFRIQKQAFVTSCTVTGTRGNSMLLNVISHTSCFWGSAAVGKNQSCCWKEWDNMLSNWAFPTDSSHFRDRSHKEYVNKILLILC